MALFAYKALESGGAPAEGRIEAGGRQEAIRQLEERGMTILRLEETAKEGNAATGAAPAARTWSFTSARVSFDALEDFTRSLSSLLTATVPLSRALTILYKEASNPAAAAKWKELHGLVIDGVPLAAAMARSPEVFPRVYTAMVESGEAGGFLDVVLGQIADFQAREKEIRAKVLSAMMYPAVLLVMATAAIIFLMVFFIPRFQTLFEGFNAALPLITQIIIGASNAIRTYGLYTAAALGAAIYFGRHWFSIDANRRKWEAVLLRLPVVGPLAAKLALARFCRMLGTLLCAGVPLMNGLHVARRSLGYQTLIDLIADSTDRVSKGETLAAALAGCRALFPGSTLEMISVAEESGRLDKELLRIAETTETTLDRNLKTAVTLAEPLLLFLIAGFIGLIFIGMVIPIFSLQDHIK
ncbi:MAG: type II secretion system F family protein [Chthoniobacteraceae bacterium]|nr:type II secretion system F family protein [Chthoniobacteraceae bacterium]